MTCYRRKTSILTVSEFCNRAALVFYDSRSPGAESPANISSVSESHNILGNVNLVSSSIVQASADHVTTSVQDFCNLELPIVTVTHLAGFALKTTFEKAVFVIPIL